MTRLARVTWFLAAVVVIAFVGVAAYAGGRGDDEADSERAGAMTPSGAAPCAVAPTPERSGTFKIGGFANLVSFGEGALWTLTQNPSDDNGSTLTVRRIDPRGGSTAVFRYLGSGDARLAVGGHALWLTDPERAILTRVDLGSGRRSVSMPFGASGEPTEMAVGNGFLWLVANNDGRLAQVELASGSAIRLIAVGSATALGDVAVGPRSVWVTTADGGMVARVDSRRAKLRGEPVRIGREALAVAVGRGTVWVQLGDDVLVGLDVRSGDPVERVNAGPNVFDVATAYGAVWASNYGVGTVTRIDATGARTLRSRIPVGRDPKGLAVGAGSVWVVNAGDCSITRIPREGR